MRVVLLVVASFAALASARPKPQLSSFKNAITTKFLSESNPLGAYKYAVETSDGFKKEEQGEIKNQGTAEESLAVTGKYSYVGDDGKTYEVKYTADENGYQPEGEHIPPSAGVKKPKLGIPSAAVASLAG